MGLLGSHLTAAEPPGGRKYGQNCIIGFWNIPPLFHQVRHSLQHEEQLTQRQLSSTQVYGTPLHLSVSALEKYRQCPYSYFLTYGLRLKNGRYIKWKR